MPYLYVAPHSQIVVRDKVVEDDGSVQTSSGLGGRDMFGDENSIWTLTTVLPWSFRSQTLSV